MVRGNSLAGHQVAFFGASYAFHNYNNFSPISEEGLDPIIQVSFNTECRKLVE